MVRCSTLRRPSPVFDCLMVPIVTTLQSDLRAFQPETLPEGAPSPWKLGNCTLSLTTLPVFFVFFLCVIKKFLLPFKSCTVLYRAAHNTLSLSLTNYQTRLLTIFQCVNCAAVAFVTCFPSTEPRRGSQVPFSQNHLSLTPGGYKLEC